MGDNLSHRVGLRHSLLIPPSRFIECAYIIVVSRKKRRVTVIFRGTKTLNDVMQDVSFNTLSKDNPVVESYPGRTNPIELNTGFGMFLLLKRDDTQTSKFDEISSKALEYGKELGEGLASQRLTARFLSLLRTIKSTRVK